MHHRLLDDPRLTCEAVAEAAARMPETQIEHNLGDLPSVLAEGDPPRLADDPAAIAREISTNGCWMVLKLIDVLPEYRALLDQLLDEVAALVPDRRLGERQAYLFLSGPGTMTPAHGDSEHNILLQVHSTKEFTVGRHPDEETKHRQLERQRRGRGRNYPYLPEDPVTVALEPGLGIYVPPDAPHLVRNGPEPGVSFSIVWHPPELVREGRVHHYNAGVRQRGRIPRPPGSSAFVDRLKSGAVWLSMATRRAVGALRRSAPR